MAVILGLLSMVDSLGLFSSSTVLVVLKVLRDSNQVSLLKQKLKFSTSSLKMGSLRNTGQTVMPKVIRVCQCWSLEWKPALLTLLPILYPYLSSLNLNHGWSHILEFKDWNPAFCSKDVKKLVMCTKRVKTVGLRKHIILLVTQMQSYFKYGLQNLETKSILFLRESLDSAQIDVSCLGKFFICPRQVGEGIFQTLFISLQENHIFNTE